MSAAIIGRAMRLRVCLVLFGLWLPVPGGVGAAEPTHALEILEEATPAELAAGSEIRVGVVVRNDGSVAWEPGQGFAVAYHWLRADGQVEEWDGLRTQLSAPVAPGAAIAAWRHAGLYGARQGL